VPVDPTHDDLRRYMAEDSGGPVVMLNLIKYKPGGRESYRGYGRPLRDYL